MKRPVTLYTGQWADLSLDELRRVVDLMEENLSEDPANEGDLRRWFQASKLI